MDSPAKELLLGRLRLDCGVDSFADRQTDRLEATLPLFLVRDQFAGWPRVSSPLLKGHEFQVRVVDVAPQVLESLNGFLEHSAVLLRVRHTAPHFRGASQ